VDDRHDAFWELKQKILGCKLCNTIPVVSVGTEGVINVVPRPDRHSAKYSKAYVYPASSWKYIYSFMTSWGIDNPIIVPLTRCFLNDASSNPLCREWSREEIRMWPGKAPVILWGKEVAAYFGVPFGTKKLVDGKLMFSVPFIPLVRNKATKASMTSFLDEVYEYWRKHDGFQEKI